MKLIILKLLLVGIIFGQNLTILENEAVTNNEDGEFYYAKLYNNSILMTSQNYKGLWIKDLSANNLTKITDASGAGYNPVISNKTKKIYFKENQFVNGRRNSSLNSFDTNTDQKNVIERSAKSLIPYTSNSQRGFLQKGNNYSILNYENNEQKSEEVIVFIEDCDIVLLTNGQRKVLRPFGKRSYIWPSISPDGTKLLFTCAGKGSYISDLEGNIITDLGYANYPSWSNDGEWILCMIDKDDGLQTISSDLEIIKSDGSIRTKLTQTDDKMEMYPSWGKTKNELVYNTEKGIIYKMTLKFDEE